MTKQREVLLSRASEQRVCPIAGCSKKIYNATAALQHSGYHALHTPLKMQHSETCPLCLGPASQCPPFLVKHANSIPQAREQQQQEQQQLLFLSRLGNAICMLLLFVLFLFLLSRLGNGI